MRQLTYVGGNKVEWWDVPAPRLQDDRDALVQPLAVTRCDLDLAIVHGRSGLAGPFALGHETAGRIVDIGGAVRNFAPGDLVIVPFQISCGVCDRCRRGHTNACTAVPFRSSYGLKPVCGVEYGGGLSDLIRVPFADHMLVHQPQGHALSQTAGLADGATDGFSAVARWLAQRPGADVLVIGGFAQSLALLAVQAAVARGAGRIVYLDDHAPRLAKAKSLGADVIEAPAGLSMEPPGLFPIVIDAAATDASMLLAIRATQRHLPAHVWRLCRDDAGAAPAHVRHRCHAEGLARQCPRRAARMRRPCCGRPLPPGGGDQPPRPLRGCA
jgi:threonine dehydrogenase-like Zn-dependent dehydrogenase